MEPEGFFIVLAEDHEASFGAAYSFKRYTSQRQAGHVAAYMATKHQKPFHIMKCVETHLPKEIKNDH
jgi:hypothetical protein